MDTTTSGQYLCCTSNCNANMYQGNEGRQSIVMTWQKSSIKPCCSLWSLNPNQHSDQSTHNVSVDQLSTRPSITKEDDQLSLSFIFKSHHLQGLNPSSTPRSPSRPSSKTHLPGTSQIFSTIMCKYYAQTHRCGHTDMIFGRSCPNAAISQRPCGPAKGDIWTTIQLNYSCSHCAAPPEPMPRYRSRETGHAGGRRR